MEWEYKIDNQKTGQNTIPKTRFYGYTIVGTMFLISTVIAVVYFAFGVYLKPILTEFGWSRGLTSGAFSLSWIVQGLACIGTGKLNDKYGPRLVITISGCILGITYLLMSHITSAWQLYLLYGVLMGAGMSGISLPIVSTISKWFIQRRNIMTGIACSGVGLGTIIGSFVAQMLISSYGWRSSYTILGIATFVLIVGLAQFLRRDPAQVGQIPFGDDKHIQKSVPENITLNIKSLIGTKYFKLIFTLFFCLAYANFAIFVHIVAHATDLGMTPATAASIMAFIGFFSIPGILILSTTADRIGNRLVYLIGFIMICTALIWLFFAGNLWEFYLFAVIFSFAVSGLNVTQAPLVASLFGTQSLGLLMALLLIGYSLGAALGSYMTGYIFDMLGSYFWPFFISAALGIIGIVLTLFLNLEGKKIKKSI